MSGARYSGWTPIVVVGDREVSAQHLPEARKLLGFVVDEAKRNGLGIASLRRELPDGTVLLAEKIGDLPRVTIIAAGVSPEDTVPQQQGGFILWPHWGHAPTDPFGARGKSADPENVYPQAWLQFVGTSKITHYRERWDVADKIIGARFASYDTPDLYPYGMRCSGNVEWKDGEDLALSWYGYYSRYFRDFDDDPGRYQFVMNQGQVLLHTHFYAERYQDPPDYLTWPISGACVRKSAGRYELVVLHVDTATSRSTEVVVYDLTLNTGTAEKADWLLGDYRHLGSVPALGTASQFADARVCWFFNASGTKATRIIDWMDQPATGPYYGTSTVLQELDIGTATIVYSNTSVDRLYGDYAVIADGATPSGFRLATQPSLPVAADYRGDDLVLARIVWKEAMLAGLSPESTYGGDVDFLVVLELDGQEIPLVERRVNRTRSMQDYHLVGHLDLRHSIVAGWRIKGTDGVHSAQAFAYLGGRLVYGEEVPAPLLASWLPGSVTDTRDFDRAQGNALLFNTWFNSTRYTPDALGQGGVAYGASPRMFANDMMAPAAMTIAMRNRYAIEDALSFAAVGSWCYAKGRYCLSMPGPNYSAPLNYLTGGSLPALLGIDAEAARFWPLSVLAKPL